MIFDSEFFGSTHERSSNNYFAAIARNGRLRLLDLSSEPFEDLNFAYNPGFTTNTQDIDINVDFSKIAIASTQLGSTVNLVPAVTVELNKFNSSGLTSCGFSRLHDRIFVATSAGCSLVESATGTVLATSTIANLQRSKFTVTSGVERLFAINSSLLYELDANTLSVIRSFAHNSDFGSSLEFDVSISGDRLLVIEDEDDIEIYDITGGVNANWINSRISRFSWNRAAQSVSFIPGSTDVLVGGFRTTTLPAIRRMTQAGVIVWTYDISPNNKTQNTTQVRRLRTDQTGSYFTFSLNSSSTENDVRNFEIRRTSNASLVFATFPSITENNSLACGFSFSSSLL
jgi:hypothetical protein